PDVVAAALDRPGAGAQRLAAGGRRAADVLAGPAGARTLRCDARVGDDDVVNRPGGCRALVPRVRGEAGKERASQPSDLLEGAGNCGPAAGRTGGGRECLVIGDVRW